MRAESSGFVVVVAGHVPLSAGDQPGLSRRGDFGTIRSSAGTTAAADLW